MLNIIGGGLAGSEAAWQAAKRGIDICLWEMRPEKTTLAHQTGNLAELVCSNSLGSDLFDRAGGLLKSELRMMNSLIMTCADETRIPAGGALAVARDEFSLAVTRKLEGHPRITIKREEVECLPESPCIVATGPLTSSTLASAIADLIGEDYLYFYDALAPIVRADSINMDVAFRASRYGRGDRDEGDYINCPLSESEYHTLVHELKGAERIKLRSFEEEDPNFFETCLPVEEIASRGDASLAFGPLRPVGLVNPHTGSRPYAVVQLRQDDAAGLLYNMVGFQTNITWPEQRRIFRLIPGLEEAEFVRLGQMHRNTFINAPVVLLQTMQFRNREDLLFAGQIAGIEGYVGNAGTGLLAGINAANLLRGKPLWILPETTMLGALCAYICSADPASFQPMKANFGLLPPPDPYIRSKRQRYRHYADRSIQDLTAYMESVAGGIS
nr:methylenetetrahydrofolate--tRNA-(uracil(54)-C(5))-methyltransferase (FADH(2)-oxidizing) TrmFO [Anaerolineae bacterium]